jgi:GDPmannose 4,6-dehydratase
MDQKGRVVVRLDARYLRPSEVQTLLGDAAKARRKLGWKPRVKFRELVAEMVREDLRIAQRDALVQEHGHRVFERRE